MCFSFAVSPMCVSLIRGCLLSAGKSESKDPCQDQKFFRSAVSDTAAGNKTGRKKRRCTTKSQKQTDVSRKSARKNSEHLKDEGVVADVPEQEQHDSASSGLGAIQPGENTFTPTDTRPGLGPVCVR